MSDQKFDNMLSCVKSTNLTKDLQRNRIKLKRWYSTCTRILINGQLNIFKETKLQKQKSNQCTSTCPSQVNQTKCYGTSLKSEISDETKARISATKATVKDLLNTKPYNGIESSCNVNDNDPFRPISKTSTSTQTEGEQIRNLKIQNIPFVDNYQLSEYVITNNVKGVYRNGAI